MFFLFLDFKHDSCVVFYQAGPILFALPVRFTIFGQGTQESFCISPVVRFKAFRPILLD